MSVKGGKFERTITRIRKISERLQEMITEDIPEALPAIEAPEGGDSSFHHYFTDFPGVFEFPSLVPDSIVPVEVIEEIEEYIVACKMLIEDLYPRKLTSGQLSLNVMGGFRSVQQKLDQFEADLQAIKQVLTQWQSSQLNTIVDRKALRELKERLIRIGFEYVHNDFQLPVEFQSNDNLIYNKTALKKMDTALPQQIEQFRDRSIQTHGFSRSSSNLIKRFRI